MRRRCRKVTGSGAGNSRSPRRNEREVDMRVSGFQGFTWFVKVVIYLAFGIAMLWALYAVGSFVYMMSNADDLSKIVATNTYELPALAKEVGANVWETENGAIRFKIHKLYGEFSYLSMPRPMVLAVFFKVLGLCGLFFIGIVQMANVFEDVSRGKPFVKENAGRLRIVGFAMAGGAIFKLLVQIAIFIQFKNEIAMRGATIPWLWLLKETLNLGLLFGGLVVIVISEIFRLGNQLQEEQELTV
jgi:Protein of unknown function (DUF2975)